MFFRFSAGKPRVLPRSTTALTNVPMKFSDEIGVNAMLCATHYTRSSTPLIIQDTQPCRAIMPISLFSSSLRLLLLRTNRHRILLTNKLHQHRPNQIPQECNSRRAHVTPHLNADGAERSARERQHPFHVVREPASRQREHGCLRVPELQEEFEAVGAEPPGALDAPVEGCFLYGDGFVCGGVWVLVNGFYGRSISRWAGQCVRDCGCRELIRL
jgi:hypothetical protein